MSSYDIAWILAFENESKGFYAARPLDSVFTEKIVFLGLQTTRGGAKKLIFFIIRGAIIQIYIKINQNLNF